jgi:hypothetical protein
MLSYFGGYLEQNAQQTGAVGKGKCCCQCEKSENSFGEEYYRDYVNAVEAARQANQKAFDQAILSLSSGSIALLLTFAKSINFIKYNCLLSWVLILFGIAVASTVVSFIVAPKAMDENIDLAWDVYIEGKEDQRTKVSKHSRIVRRLNNCSAISFLFAAALAVWFVCKNI